MDKITQGTLCGNATKTKKPPTKNCSKEKIILCLPDNAEHNATQADKKARTMIFDLRDILKPAPAPIRFSFSGMFGGWDATQYPQLCRILQIVEKVPMTLQAYISMDTACEMLNIEFDGVGEYTPQDFDEAAELESLPAEYKEKRRRTKSKK